MDTVLPVTYQIQFVDVSPSGPQAVAPVPGSSTSNSTGVPWVMPEPSTFVLAAIGTALAALIALRRGGSRMT
ncbi:MAG: hypothetical protein HY288_05900 [Planctomycetia bacterium]|nr:hypothetical protein [Planctomycetia bacterium]